MSKENGDKVRVGSSSLGSTLRGIGRAALWTVVALLLVRGTSSVLSPPVDAAAPSKASVVDEAGDAFAVHFAREYLSEPSFAALSPLLADGARIGSGHPPASPGAEVTQAEVVRRRALGDGQAVVTVACDLRDARTLYLAVPIASSGAGEVAALGAPSFVAAPAVAGVDTSRPQPLAGPDAAAIEALLEKFLPAYLSAARRTALSYLLVPGARIVPLAGSLELLGAIAAGQVDQGEGPRRAVVASARVRDPHSDASYPVEYRLELVKRGRWYVQSVQGGLS